MMQKDAITYHHVKHKVSCCVYHKSQKMTCKIYKNMLYFSEPFFIYNWLYIKKTRLLIQSFSR